MSQAADDRRRSAGCSRAQRISPLEAGLLEARRFSSSRELDRATRRGGESPTKSKWFSTMRSISSAPGLAVDRQQLRCIGVSVEIPRSAHLECRRRWGHGRSACRSTESAFAGHPLEHPLEHSRCSRRTRATGTCRPRPCWNQFTQKSLGSLFGVAQPCPPRASGPCSRPRCIHMKGSMAKGSKRTSPTLPAAAAVFSDAHDGAQEHTVLPSRRTRSPAERCAGAAAAEEDGRDRDSPLGSSHSGAHRPGSGDAGVVKRALGCAAGRFGVGRPVVAAASPRGASGAVRGSCSSHHTSPSSVRATLVKMRVGSPSVRMALRSWSRPRCPGPHRRIRPRG